MALYDLIIIGAGPAGITAGIYAARQGLNTLLLTKDFGGQMARKAVEIENYPGFEQISGRELIQRFEKHLKKQKIDIEKGEVRKMEKSGGKFIVSVFSIPKVYNMPKAYCIVSAQNKKNFESKTVIIASGADPRLLEVPGEKEFLGRGVSYCTTCDAPLFSGKTVAVIGGGNSGLEAAIALNNFAKKIYVLEAGYQVTADAVNQERVRKIIEKMNYPAPQGRGIPSGASSFGGSPRRQQAAESIAAAKIKIITSAVLKEIQGEKFVKAIVYQDKKSQKNLTLKVEGVFVEIGYQPATSFVKKLVDFNERDEIKVDFETCQTKTAGLFAAGDCNVGKYKQIITACGEGAKAAMAVYDYLQKTK